MSTSRKNYYYIYRSSITGKFVSGEFARCHPAITYKHKVKKVGR